MSNRVQYTMLDRLSKLDSCAVSDALDKLDVKGAVAGLVQLTSTRKIFGKVITVQLAKIDTEKSHTEKKIHLGATAIDQGGKDNVIVVSHQGRIDVAGWGGILSQAAKLKGIKGVIIDGAVRDIDESKEEDFPIYGLVGVPVSARRRIEEISTNEPIHIKDILVNPGDYVLADGSGVVFISSELINQAIETAEDIAKKEKTIVKKIQEGSTVSNAMDDKYENMLK